MAITIRIITHPMTTTGRATELVAWREGLMLADAVPERCREDFTVSTSHEVRIDPARWAEYALADGDEVVCVAQVRDPLSVTMALIGLGVVIGVDSVLLGGAVFGPVGDLLLSPFAPPELGGANDSPTYSWSGIRNTANTDIPVPVVYGKHRVGGNILSQFTHGIDLSYPVDQQAGAGDSPRLLMLIAIGEGEVESIGGVTADSGATTFGEDWIDATDSWAQSTIGENIRVNGEPLHSFEGAMLATRMGTDEQTSIFGFDKTHASSGSIGTTLSIVGDELTYSTDTVVNEVILHLQSPGLFHINLGSHIREETLTFLVEYRETGSSGWTALDEVSYSRRTTASISYQYSIRNLAPAKYDVRLTKTGRRDPSVDDDIHSDLILAYVDEVQYDNVAYPNTALLAISLIANEQISGAAPTITTVVEGRKVFDPRANGGAGGLVGQPTSSNPVLCALELIINERYGLGEYVDATLVDLPRMAELADYCEEQVASEDGGVEDRYKMDLVLDTQGTAIDTLSRMCAGFSAAPAWIDGQFSMIIDKAESPTQLFTMGNIVEDTFAETFVSLKATPNKIIIEYADESIDYQRTSIIIINEDSYDGGEPVRPQTIFLPGVTRTSQAIRMGKWILNSGTFNTRSISFRAAVDATACTVGDVVSVAHDVPAWGVLSGRVSGGGAATVQLSEELVIPGGASYYITVRHATPNSGEDLLETLAITSPDDATYAPGDDLDVASPWGTVPVSYDTYSIGEQTTITKPYRVKSLTREDNAEVQFNASEYNVGAFSDTGIWTPGDSQTNHPDPNIPPNHATGLAATASAESEGMVLLTWVAPTVDTSGTEHTQDFTPFPHHYDVELRTNDPSVGTGVYNAVGSSNGTSFELTGLLPLQEYTARVISVSRFNVRAPSGTAPFVTFTTATALAPPNVTGLELKDQGTDREFVGRDIVFAWRDVGSVATDAFNNTAAGSGAHEPTFRDYLVEVWVNDVRVHQAYTPNPEWVYSFEMNTIDNGTAVRGSATVDSALYVKVYARTRYQALSANPATLSVYNTAPAAPTGLVTSLDFRTMVVAWNANAELDIATYRLYRSEISGFSPVVSGTVTKVYDGPDTEFTDTGLADTTYYYKVTALDTFPAVESAASLEASVTTGLIDSPDIEAGAITANKIFVSTLEAITANMGSLTAGDILLSLLADPTRKVRLDNAGLYVSNDNGVTWRKVIGLDDDGNVILSFDAYDSLSRISGVGIISPPDEIKAVTILAAGIAADAWDPDWVTSPVLYNEFDFARVFFSVSAENDSGPNPHNATVKFALFDDTDTLVWESNEYTADVGAGQTDGIAARATVLLSDYGVTAQDVFRVGVKHRGTGFLFQDFVSYFPPASEAYSELEIVANTGAGAGAWSPWNFEQTRSVVSEVERNYVSLYVDCVDTNISNVDVEVAIFDGEEVQISDGPIARSFDPVGAEANRHYGEATSTGDDEYFFWRNPLELRGPIVGLPAGESLGLAGLYKIGYRTRVDGVAAEPATVGMDTFQITPGSYGQFDKA